MDEGRFDDVTRIMGAGAAPSRRHLMRLLAGAALAGVAARIAPAGSGAQTASAARCLGDKKACKRDSQCCSGVCRTKKCRSAPGQGTCTIRKDVCKLTGGIGFGPKCNGVAGCECIKTKSGAAFCREIGGAACTPCFGDGDCAVAFGAGAKCIAGAACGDPCGIGDFCAVPCGFDAASRPHGGDEPASVAP